LLDKVNLLTTGIGSLPDIGEKEALNLIEKTFPTCPHWPQFPTRNEEYFSSQFLQPLVELGMLKREKGNNPRILNHAEDFLERATEFYELYLDNAEGEALGSQFSIPEESARGFYAFLNHLEKKGTNDALFVKGQLVGPLTAGMQVYNEEGDSCFFDNQLRDLIVKTLELDVMWQIRELKKIGLPVIIFLDEGLMHAYGHKEFLSLKAAWIIDSFTSLIDVIKREGAIPGIHACSMADWSVLLKSKPTIINLDVYNYFTSLLSVSDELNSFLEEGGYIAWGIVPVFEACYEETPESLKERLYKYMDRLCSKGVDEKLLFQQMIITPSCGTGLYPPELARRVYQLTAELREEIIKEY